MMGFARKFLSGRKEQYKLTAYPRIFFCKNIKINIEISITITL
jgi:hypothetical protein